MLKTSSESLSKLLAFLKTKFYFKFRTLETDNATLQQVSINNNGGGHIITNNSGDEEMDPDEV